MMSSNIEEQTSASTPLIEVELSFDRATHSYSNNDTPPIITFTITSRADYPVTIFTWRRPLHPKRDALIYEGYTITDTATKQQVKVDTPPMVSSKGISRLRGHADEQYYLSLLPGVPTEVSGGFGPTWRKPLPYSLIKSGHVLDENGKELPARRSPYACGVEGLEPGHQYSIGLNQEKLEGCFWAVAGKDEILVDEVREGSKFGDYKQWRNGNEMPLRFSVQKALLDVLK